jgi:hypothetical protein
MAKRRRPVRVEYTRTVYYGGGRPRSKRWPWQYLVAGVVGVIVLPYYPVVAILILTLTYYLWRHQRG